MSEPIINTKMNTPNTDLTAIENLRDMVRAFDTLNESFNDRFTLPELVRIWDAWQQCGWDIYPDGWTDKQVREAIRGIAPDWIETRFTIDPVYHADRATSRRVIPTMPTVSRRPSK